MVLLEDVMTKDERRLAFDALSGEVFGLSFETWYQKGFWTECYKPYTIFEDDRAVANVSVSVMELLLHGERKRYAQLGTVMTHPDYRGRGLCRRLMETVLPQYRRECQGIFLFANRSVLDFYPKFGFVPAAQYRFAAPAPDAIDGARPLDPEKELSLLRRCYGYGNPFSMFQTVEGFGLLMFYCDSIYKDCLWYLPEYDAVAVAQQEGDTVECLDVFCKPGPSLWDVLARLCAPGTKRVSLGFTPNQPGFEKSRLDEDDDALFILESLENPFAAEPLHFPDLAHT